MRRPALWRIWTGLAVFFSLISGLLPAQNSASDHVVILANSTDAESVELAAYYARARKVPQNNVVLLRMPRTEELVWASFSKEILTPLRKILVERGLLDGRFSKEEDAFGRLRFIPLSNSVEYLVVCRGVPLRLKNEISKVSGARLEKIPKNYRTTIGSLDGELALLATENHAPSGWVPNPLFNRKRPGNFTKEAVVKVARLDGPTHEACLRLVDLAQAGEQTVYGRAYVDAGGPHKQGNDWMETVTERLRGEGFEVDLEDSSKLFHAGHRFDAPLFYFGWHSYHARGPFVRKDIKFPPGAMVFHIHSFSAQSLRTDSRYWVGPLIDRGVTATIGNVAEPYLHLSHHLPLLLEGLLAGRCLADAAYYSLPALSWQAILIGDPLYRPALDRSLLKLPGGRRDFAPFHLEQHGMVRRIRILEGQGKTTEALALGRTYLNRAYGLPLALELARIEINLDHSEAVIPLLVPASRHVPSGFQEIRPLLQAAKLLNRYGQAEHFSRIIDNLRKIRNLPKELQDQIR